MDAGKLFLHVERPTPPEMRILSEIALAICCPLTVLAQAPRGAAEGNTAVLMGIVVDDASSRPIVDAEVHILSTNILARTDSRGAFLLADVPLGLQVVVVRHMGYSPLRANFTFLRAKTVEGEFRLAPNAPVALDTINVKASEGPARFGGAIRSSNFIPRSEFEKQSHRRMSDILVRLPGLQVRHGVMGRAWIAHGRGTSTITRQYQPTQFERQQGARPGCYANVYLDGAIVFSGREPLFDVNSVSPAEIESVEYYGGPAQIPAEHNRTGSACGVLLIWTRKR